MNYILDFANPIAVGINTKVVRAYLANSSQVFAAKLIDYSNKPMEFVQRARQEARLLQELNGHPNIIKTYAVYEKENTLHIIMEYIDCDLLSHLSTMTSGMSENDARELFKQLLNIVQHLHKKLIVHGDIKLENLLFDKNSNRVVMIDFGSSSKLTKKSQKLNLLTGTAQYVAPEVVLAQEYNGFKSDVYSLGVVLFALATNRLPFDDEDGVYYYSWVENFHDLLKNPAPREMPPVPLSPSLLSLLERVLCMHPEQRLCISKVKKEAWFKTKISKSKDSSIGNSHCVPKKNSFFKMKYLSTILAA
eukprot:TRINITY_DN3179_c0_g1_i2.p1 TRINITY_DN3179_c0_g1~~TRINITY_DN3179_c0_g1_i2.p1  ORF type:complete len:305 (-),score=70.61 TRINITY_DN3179_c0_g1_i2:161-1075(-)